VESAKTDPKQSGLNLDEFTNLVFNCDDTMKVNLKDLHPMSRRQSTKPPSGHSLKSVGSAFQQEAQWKFYMQKSLKNLCNDLLRGDEDKSYLVGHEDLMKIINRRTQMPESLKYGDKSKLVEYVDRFQEGDKINYRNLMEDVQMYDYMADTSQVKSAGTVRSGLTDAIAKPEPKSIFDEDYIVLDQKKVPQNVIESIENKMIKVNRKIKRVFKDENELDSKIKECVTADANGNVSVDQLRDFVLELVEDDMINKRVTKRDVEGFLSAFSYNTYGATNVDSISKLIYTRDDQIPNKLAERKWANPPPCDVNKDISTKDIGEADVHNSRTKDLFS